MSGATALVARWFGAAVSGEVPEVDNVHLSNT